MRCAAEPRVGTMHSHCRGRSATSPFAGRNVLTSGVCLTLLALLYLPSQLSACNVPVFRYALEHWSADPYDVIVFHRLTREQIAQIVEIQLRGLAATLADRGITLTWSAAAKNTIGARGYDPTYGARPLKRLIQKEVMDTLAEKILNQEIAPGDTVEVTASSAGGPVAIRRTPEKQKAAV